MDIIPFYNKYSSVSFSEYKSEKFKLQIELLKLQEYVIKNKLRVAIVFEGRDAAGKGSTIKRIVENLMTKHIRVVAIGSPTEKENRSWFHTFYQKMPSKGEIVLFDRSWYSRAMIQPTMKYCSEGQYNYFMSKVNKWEESLVKNEHIIIIKIYLSVDKATQIRRFELRKNHHLKYWKLSKNDINSIPLWDRYTLFKDKMLTHTSTKNAPWTIINANNKKLARLNSIRFLLNHFGFDYEKPISKSRTNKTSIQVAGVYFNDLTPEQYDFLESISRLF